MSKRKWISVSFIVLLAVLACNLTAPEQPQAPAFPTENPHFEVERITLEKAKAAYDNGTAVFLDVRGAGSYAQGHIPGALSIPSSQLQSRLGELDPDQWIITYCT